MSENLQYTGWKKWHPTSEEWAAFFERKEVPFELLENEYLIVYDNDNCATYYCYENGQLRQFRGGSIKFNLKNEPGILDFPMSSESKKVKTGYKQSNTQNNITPRNEFQACAFDLLNNDDITVKLLTGVPGSGKTMLAVYEAMQLLKSGKVEKIVWLRNNIAAMGTDQIGYLPGSELQKNKVWAMPLIDHLQGESRVFKLIENGQLEIPALCFLRGRNIENACIICSEAQNLTEELVKLIISRVGEGSYLIFDGDFKRQVDRQMFEKSPGLKKVVEVLAGNKLFGYVDLPISERSETAKLVELFED